MAFITVNRSASDATHAQRLLQINNLVKQLRESIETLVDEIFELLNGASAAQEASFTDAATKLGVTAAEAKSIYEKLAAAKLVIDGGAQAPSLKQLAIMIG